MKRVLSVITLISALFLLAFAYDKSLLLQDKADNISSTEMLDVEEGGDSSIPTYEEESYTGYAYSRRVLSKGMGENFANIVKEANTIYEIRDVFDLNGKTVTIPENCVLRFDGGALINGTIVGNNTVLEGPATSILDKTLNFQKADLFHVNGIYFPKGKDISALAQRMLDEFNVLELQTGTYYLSSSLVLKHYYAKIKGNGKSTVITTKRELDYAIRTVFDSEVSNPGNYYNASFIEISDLKIDGGESKKFKNGVFLNGPSCTVSNCYITNIKSVGVKLSRWCNNLFNCIITHCDIGALISQNANSVNVCSNRIESNTINLIAHRYSGINICNNTLEGGATFNIVVGEGQSCKIRDNYFEGSANSVTSLLTTTENRHLAFSGKKELKGLLWIGAIDLSEKDNMTKVKYKIGSQNAPAVVVIEDNFIDIHPEDLSMSSAAPDIYFVLIGSCKVSCSIINNSFTRTQNAVCGFFDIDNAYLANTEVINNYVAGTIRPNNSLDLITDNPSKGGWNKKNRIVGKIELDNK